MEHEEIYALMMDALDGELAEDNHTELEVHLRACPDCQREWHALQAIERLLQQAPMLSPAAGFTQRTLARLPNRRYRIWAIAIIYVLLFLSGVLPLLLGLWIYNTVAPLLSEPNIVQSVWATLTDTARAIGAVAAAILSGVGETIMQQPTIIGWFLVMIGIVALWGGVYQQLVSQPRNVSQ